MNHPLIKNGLPHLIAIVIMLALSLAFFAPEAFQGKTLKQGDIEKAEGMQGEIVKYRKEKGETILWTNSMFGGMPTYQVHFKAKGDFTKPVRDIVLFGRSWMDANVLVFLALLSCYLLLIVLNVDWRIALLGSIAYGLSSYNMDILEAGHLTKMLCLGFSPAIFAGIILIYQKRFLLGGGLLGLSLALQLSANHVQITYYTLILAAILGIAFLIDAFRQKKVAEFFKASAVVVGVSLLSLASSANKLMPTYEYSKETIRGTSELASLQAKGDGLDKAYASKWSYGIFESLTTLAQNVNGGGISQSFEDTDTYKKIAPGIKQQLAQQGYTPAAAKKSAKRQVASLFYWGDQPVVGVAIYFGAIVWFLFILGIFLVKGRLKWWLVAAAITAFIISWGDNFIGFEFIFNNVPMYNKFRAVSMVLGLGQLMFVLLGALALQRIFSKEITLAEKNKALLYSVASLGGLLVLLVLGGSMMDFSGTNDGLLPQSILPTIKADRASMYRMDILRSLALVLLTAGLIWANLNQKIKASYAILGIGTLMFLDVWTVGKRIIPSSKFEDKVAVKKTTNVKLPADDAILSDTDPHYRVLDVFRGSPYTSSVASTFHKSIGGYHAAKLALARDMNERYFSDPNTNMHLLGMMNVKYIIQDANRPFRNPKALGNAWFVNDFKIVSNADEELNALQGIDPANTAVFQQKNADLLDLASVKRDSTASISLISYHPDTLTYTYSAKTDQLALFSEVYYPPSKGWNMYLNGALMSPFAKANYILRAAKLPAGQNQKLQMIFEPSSVKTGATISMISSLLILGIFILGLFFHFKGNGLTSPVRVEEENWGVKQKAVPTVRNTKAKTSAKKKKKK